jgi:hypothetical protein
MKVTVSEPQELQVKTKRPDPVTNKSVEMSEPRVRFSVSLVDDDGEALWTQQGFTIDPYRVIRVPMQRPRFGFRAMQFTHIHPRFADDLREAVLSIPDVPTLLGPVPDRPPNWESAKAPAKRIKGRATVKEDSKG